MTDCWLKVSSIYFNARSLVNKLTELHYVLYTKQYDIVFVTESWLYDGVTDGLLDPESRYFILRKDRSQGKGGGVCVFISKCFNPVPIVFHNKYENLEIVGFDVRFASHDVRFFTVYRPPSYDAVAFSYMNTLLDCLSVHSYSDKTVVIIGDLNLPKINWNCITGPTETIYSQFLLFVIDLGFTQLIDFSTHNTNILDLVLCNDTDHIHNISADVPFGSSDHSIVISMLFTGRGNKSSITHNDQAYIWRLADLNGIECFLSVIRWLDFVSQYPSARSYGVHSWLFYMLL